MNASVSAFAVRLFHFDPSTTFRRVTVRWTSNSLDQHIFFTSMSLSMQPLEPLEGDPRIGKTTPTNSRRPSRSSTSKPDPLSSVVHASASRIGPGAHPTGHPVSLATELSAEENAKRLAAYAAVDEHVKDYHKVLGIG